MNLTSRLLCRSGRLLPWGRSSKDHSAAAQEHACDGQDRWDQTQYGPKDFSQPAEPAKVQVTEHQQQLIGDLVTRIEQAERAVECLWKSKIDS